MKTIVTGFLCACVLMSASGCSGAYSKAEAATKDLIAATDDVSAALESVKDKETAEAAAPKIEAGIERMKDAKKKLEGIKGTKADQEKFNKEYESKANAAGDRLKKALLEAGPKCEAEPTFLKALTKMEELK